jgi:TRAP-type C4-dicarboxylate transport system permease small subunit
VNVLELLAKLCAILAGVLLTVITLMTCASLIGRNTTGWTIVGDFELSGAAAGAAIALFLPWCQVRRGNIIVDFFTAKATERTNGALDRLGSLLFAAGAGPDGLAHRRRRHQCLDQPVEAR